MIYLRSHNDTSGDVVDMSWYCSHVCYADSLRAVRAEYSYLFHPSERGQA